MRFVDPKRRTSARLHILSVTVLAVMVLAAVPVAAGTGAGCEPLFNTGFGGRSLAMGGSFVALFDEPTTVLYNPAGLGVIESSRLTAGFSQLSGSTDGYSVFAVLPDSVFGGMIGFGATSVRVRDRVRINDGPRYTTDDSRQQMIVSYGHRRGLYDQVWFGGSFKIVRNEFGRDTTWGVGADLSAIYPIDTMFTVGASVRDIELRGMDDITPISLAFGISARSVDLAKMWNGTFSGEYVLVDDSTDRVHLGAEAVRTIDADLSLAVRTGFSRLLDANDNSFALGAGAVYKGIDVDLSYSWFYDSDQYDNNGGINLSVSVPLDRARTRRPVETITVRDTVLVQPEVSDEDLWQARRDTLQRYRRASYEEYLSEAGRLMAGSEEDRFDRALGYAWRAMAFTESEREVDTVSALLDSARAGLAGANDQRYSGLLSNREQSVRRALSDSLAESNYEQAEALSGERKFAQALARLQNIPPGARNRSKADTLEMNIKDSRDLDKVFSLVVASSAEKEGLYSRAIEAYLHVLELDPTYAEAETRLRLLDTLAANAYTGTPEERRADLQAVDELNRIWIDSLKQAMAEGNPFKVLGPAIEERFISLRTAPDAVSDRQRDAEYDELYKSGLEAYQNEDYEKAMVEWDKVLKKYPEDLEVLISFYNAWSRSR